MTKMPSYLWILNDGFECNVDKAIRNRNIKGSCHCFIGAHFFRDIKLIEDLCTLDEYIKDSFSNLGCANVDFSKVKYQ